ncbi:hypothetical protein FOL47_001750 [Perkinsus chesapeaki]|uniref:Ion transport domain-containing protein n=1 Tax=Perkinsus chesapeaki TaxID=330153 RepID=A0A7J6MH59_PERCH|nr:hypothetical protein FOL47_001750 [Perkinsus chesapeaki]
MKMLSVGVMGVLGFIKELCEGHYAHWQNGVRMQASVGGGNNSGNSSACNLTVGVCDALRDSAWLIPMLNRYDDFVKRDVRLLAKMLSVTVSLFCTITELCQGPCEGNQSAAARKTKLLSSVNHIWLAINKSSEQEESPAPPGGVNRWLLKRSATSLLTIPEHDDLTTPLLNPDKVDDGPVLRDGTHVRDKAAVVNMLQMVILDTLSSLLEGGHGSDTVRLNADTMAISLDTNMLTKLLEGAIRKGQASLAARYMILIDSITRRVTMKSSAASKWASYNNTTPMLKAVRESLQDRIGSVEIVNCRDQLEHIYFIVPDSVLRRAQSDEFEALKERVMHDVPRDNPVQKCQSFLDMITDSLVWELTACDFMKKRRIVLLQPQLLDATFLLSILLNALAIIINTTDRFHPLWASLLWLLGLVHAVLSMARFISCTVSKLPMNLLRLEPDLAHKLDEEQDLSLLVKAGVPLLWFIPWYHLTYLLMSISAWSFAGEHVYFFHLFDIILQSSLLKVTLRSIQSQGLSLASTGMLWLLIMYSFAMVGHRHFRGDFPEGECRDVTSCIAFVMNFGLRAGGGLGDYLKGGEEGHSEGWGRMVFDTIYFILSTVVMANIVSGIIIDAFGESRDKRNEVLLDQKNNCFVCSLAAAKFDRADRLTGFRHHYKRMHNMWAYVYFVAYLKLKDPTELTGTEDYVKAAVERHSIDWLPVLRASMGAGERKELREDIGESS